MAIEDQFIIDLDHLVESSKKAGYLNHIANSTQKLEDLKKYEEARKQEVIFYSDFLAKYQPYLTGKEILPIKKSTKKKIFRCSHSVFGCGGCSFKA
jgi:hypothetical protein